MPDLTKEQLDSCEQNMGHIGFAQIESLLAMARRCLDAESECVKLREDVRLHERLIERRMEFYVTHKDASDNRRCKQIHFTGTKNGWRIDGQGWYMTPIDALRAIEAIEKGATTDADR